MQVNQYLEKMRKDWDQRARENAFHYVANGRDSWTAEEFFQSGEVTVGQDILTDMGNICQGKDPKAMRILELGCGAGRVTRALARIFGSVHGVDISPEMLQRAEGGLADCKNVVLHQGDGWSLDVLGDTRFDFAYSCCVFHHISSYDVMRRYLEDIAKRLVPGGLFKFEVQGCPRVRPEPGDTWLGAPVSEDQAREMAANCGCELRYLTGAGEERMWLWYFKLPS
ncbi:MAG TPA: class I SAM-dependent methyltransferase [Bryobacteraceae bacterium]|jgi:SAM-dependent methyltransferase